MTDEPTTSEKAPAMGEPVASATERCLMEDDVPEARRTGGLWHVTQRGLAAIALLAALPVLAVVAVALRLESRGPFFFTQQRRGLGDRPFTILKVRTMRPGSERRTALGTTSSSPEVTRIGRLLRNLKIDELPQLWNIVRGDMEIVGPRPIPIALDDELRTHIPGFARRYRVRPGLTSVGQVCVRDNQLGDRLVRDWSERFEGELQYLRCKSFAYDCLLIGMTTAFVLRRLVRRERTAPTDGATGVPSTTVLGIPIANLDYDGAVATIASWIASRRRTYVGVCPVHSIVEAGLRPDHRTALLGAGMNTADGMPVVWAKRLLGDRRASRVYGPTLMMRTLERAEQEGWRIAFYGGHPDRLPLLCWKLRRRFPMLDIVEAISPPFRPLSDAERLEHIDRLRMAAPDVIWVGLGCPKQEAWMAAHSPYLDSVLVGVGAAFDFHAGTLRQAPRRLQQLGLEWAFRLACEPTRLFRRYATTNPIYLCRLVPQLASAWILRRRYETRHLGTMPTPSTSSTAAHASSVAANPAPAREAVPS